MEQKPPHLHPLNQAAEMLLQKLGDTIRRDDSIAVIALALATAGAESGRVQLAQSLRRWEAEPRWQRLALATLEKSLTPQTLLMLGPQQAGARIAAILGG